MAVEASVNAVVGLTEQLSGVPLMSICSPLNPEPITSILAFKTSFCAMSATTPPVPLASFQVGAVSVPETFTVAFP